MATKRNSAIPSWIASVLLFSFAATAQVGPKNEALTLEQQTESALAEFFSSSEGARKVMDQSLPKFENGKAIKAKSQFSVEQQQSSDFVVSKDARRKKFCKVGADGIRVCLGDPQGRAAFQNNDRVENLVDNSDSVLNTLEAMEKASLTSASLKETPWSDTYWPLYRGAAAHRFADEEFPASTDWKVNFDYFEKKVSPTPSDISVLSPAEKYDLLVGDTDYTLTRNQWQSGGSYYSPDKGVETWMGLCHGWAPAAFMLNRPSKSVTVTAADGKTKIKFLPSDMKALSTLLWANANPSSRFIGGRCDVKNPAKTSDGRVKSQECFDTNPATWHMAVVNQIGVSKRSFVIDATFDYEVWNQPVSSYKYTYFNPETGKTTASLKTAKIPMSEFTNDKFSKERDNAEATQVVGVAMEMTYVVETEPSVRTTDSATFDATNSVRYMYDLELNDKNELIGGEWYTNEHPDFLWVPAPDTRATTPADIGLRGTWNAKTEEFPSSWKRNAATGSRMGLPLAKVIDALLEQAQK